MAAYSFETISADEAASFGTGDYLFFISNGATANQVTAAPFTQSSGVLSGSGITLSYGGKSVTFNNSLSAASQSGHVLFNDNSHLLLGTQSTTADNLTPTASSGTGNGTGGGGTTTPGTVTDPYTVYALSGDDTINFTTTGANVSNYLNGGFGADTINGGNGSNHIYGNSIVSTQGQTQNGQADAGDTITVGSGSNYINGNAGDDTITAGTATSTASNRIFGGADNDVINIMGNGHSNVNGNQGNDSITDSGAGDSTLRGGMGNDTIFGGSGHSVLSGDVGNDYIHVHGNMGEGTTTGTGATATTTPQHIDLISGGTGSDTFDFSAAGSAQAALFGQATYFQEVTDFDTVNDKFILNVGTTGTGNAATAFAFTDPSAVGHSSTVFGSITDAEVYAQGQLNSASNNTAARVEALSVGSANDTYLFFRDAAVTQVTGSQVAGIGVIHVDGVSAANVTYDNFTNNTGGTSNG